MVLNDPRCSARIEMWNTWDVAENESVVHMLEWIAHIAKKTDDGKFKNLVFNSHGSPASVKIGGRLKGLVEKIWFNGCEVAKPGDGVDDGLSFCSKIAKAAECYVLASDTIQVDRVRLYQEVFKIAPLPRGKIGTFEGTLLSFARAALWRAYHVERSRH